MNFKKVVKLYIVFLSVTLIQYCSSKKISPPYRISIYEGMADFNGVLTSTSKHPALKRKYYIRNLFRPDLYKILSRLNNPEVQIYTVSDTSIIDLQSVLIDLRLGGVHLFELFLDDEFLGKFYVMSQLPDNKIEIWHSDLPDKIYCDDDTVVILIQSWNKTVKDLKAALKKTRGCKLEIRWTSGPF